MINSRSVYFMLFALSGFSGLIYESIWTRYLKLFLGHAAYAQALVLAIFMGGMAIGSWLCSRYTERWKNLLLGYSIAEGIIGLCSLLFHAAFTHTIDFAHTSIIPLLGNHISVNIFKWVLSALMILPQSVLLGMTFPLMCSGLIRLFPDRPGRNVSLLYFCNSMGAAMGGLVSGFILIRLSGLPGTIMIAGLINLVLAVSVFFLIRGNHPGVAMVKTETSSISITPVSPLQRMLLVISLVTGIASFMYEIGWIRMLSMVLSTTTQAFELMLSAFILGLALGGLWINRRIDSLVNPVAFLAFVQLLMGVLALLTLILYGQTFEVMKWIYQALPLTGYGSAFFTASSSAIAMAVMLPATFCAGMTLPLITLILMRTGLGERSVGAVYAANTVGAIIGVFFAIHLGLPLLGLKGLITFGATLDILLGITLLWGVETSMNRWRTLVLVSVAGVCAVGGTLLFVHLDPYKMASGVYRVGYLLHPDDGRLLYQKDGKTATVTCMVEKTGHMSIKTNGKTDAAINITPGAVAVADETTNILLGVLPMVLHPRAESVATIGLGSGLTSQTLLCNPRLQLVDTVEIEERIIEAAKNFRPRVDLVYTDPRSHIHNDDARTYFSTYNRKYDVIVSEPSATWVSGTAGLFSLEFYRLINRHLRDDGLFVQWLHIYELDLELVVSVLKAISANFSDFDVYMVTDADMIIVARPAGVMPAPDFTAFRVPAVAALLNRIQVKGEQDLAFRRVGGKKNLDRFLASFAIRANSDYYPVLEQNGFRAFLSRSTENFFTEFVYTPLPLKELLGWSSRRPDMTDVNPSPYLVNTQASFAATEFRDSLAMGRHNPGVVATKLENLSAKMVQACSDFSSGNEDERLGIAFNLSIALIPYLSSKELAPVWKLLETGECSSGASFRELLWYDLFKSAGRRDAARLTQDAAKLLSNEGDLPQQAKKYLLASGMMGALALGDRGMSGRLWAQYRERVFGNTTPDILFLLLAAESVAQ